MQMFEEFCNEDFKWKEIMHMNSVLGLIQNTSF